MRWLIPALIAVGGVALLVAVCPASAEDAVDQDFKAPDQVSLTNAKPGGSPKSLSSPARAVAAAPVQLSAPMQPGQFDPQAAFRAAGFADGLPAGAKVNSSVDADGTLNIVISTPDGGTRIIRQGPAAGGQQTFVLRTN
jgi:hypothetical protein